MSVTQPAMTSPAPAPVASVVASAPAMSVLAALMDVVPLDVLLEATGARVCEMPGDFDDQFGGGVERRGSRITLVLPAGRPGWQRDMVCRDLLARVLDVQLPGMEPTKVLAAA